MYGPVCSGIKSDVLKRFPLYLTDFQDTLNLKVLASILFMFFTSIGPAATFASLLQSQTDDVIGFVEIMVSTAVTGCLWSLFSGQPLVILGVTGPVSILTISIYTVAESLDINFLPFYAWSQIWASFFHVILACINFCELITLITRFSVEIFGCLIAIIYIYTGIVGIVEAYQGGRAHLEQGLFHLLIALGCAWLAMRLSEARHWKCFNSTWRDIIADYGPTASLVLWSAVPLIGLATEIDIDHIDVPNRFQTTNGRGWIVNLTDIEVSQVLLAIIPGLIITVLFFFDHNVSSLMAQAPEFRLKKPSAFHWDFLVMGLLILVTGILGIPPTNGLIPQAPLHTQSLTVTRLVPHPTDSSRRIEEVVKVYEQRVSNFMQAILIGIMAFPPFLGIIALVPTAALDGLFLFMGVASLGGNHFFERFSLIFDEESLRHSHQPWFEPVPFEFLVQFTTVQAVCCIIIFGITLTPAATIFPLLIGVLIPFRLYVLPKYLDAEVIEHLDPYDKDAQLVTGSDDILKHVHISVAEGQYDPPPEGSEGITYSHHGENYGDVQSVDNPRLDKTLSLHRPLL